MSAYPNIKRLKIPISAPRDGYPNYCPEQEMQRIIIRKLGQNGWAEFQHLMRGHTMVVEGPYPWDVESALERIMSTPPLASLPQTGRPETPTK